jgi:hypothetical protein
LGWPPEVSLKYSDNCDAGLKKLAAATEFPWSELTAQELRTCVIATREVLAAIVSSMAGGVKAEAIWQLVAASKGARARRVNLVMSMTLSPCRYAKSQPSIKSRGLVFPK